MNDYNISEALDFVKLNIYGKYQSLDNIYLFNIF